MRSYLDIELYKELFLNAVNCDGDSYHFVYEWWAANEGLWTIHKFTNGVHDENGLDYYALKSGLKRYSGSHMYVYRYDKKKKVFITRKITDK